MRKSVENVFFLIASVAIIGALIITAVNEAKFNISQVLLMLALVLITCIYAMRTSDIAKATREQANASMKMAEEMRNAMSPSITIKWGGPDPNRRKISAFLENEGAGPALNLKCYLAYKEKTLDYDDKSRVLHTTFKVGEKYPLSLSSGDFDFKAWNGLSIKCDYESILGDKFRSILMCESEKNRRLKRIKLNSGDKND